MSDETGTSDEGAGDDAESNDVGSNDVGSDDVGSNEAGSNDVGSNDEVVAEAEVVEPDTSEPLDADESTVNDPTSSGSASTHDDDPVEGILAAVTAERDEYLDALRQLQADFENYRKQTLRRQGEAIEHATGRLVEELLTVLDACDAGIEHGDEGVVAIFTTLLGVLEKAGLERIDPSGEPFDPNAHEAVLHEPDSDGDDGPTVVEVLRPGYRWKERTLRAAMVKVKG